MDLKRIVRIAMMAALIFAGTYTFKIPIAITGGYTHLGDCAIFVGVMLLGRKDGALAAALGAALSDLLSGAMLWVLPTFIIKGIMALIMGLAVEKLMPEHRYGWLIGEVLGGVCQIVGYQLGQDRAHQPCGGDRHHSHHHHADDCRYRYRLGRDHDHAVLQPGRAPQAQLRGAAI